MGMVSCFALILMMPIVLIFGAYAEYLEDKDALEKFQELNLQAIEIVE